MSNSLIVNCLDYCRIGLSGLVRVFLGSVHPLRNNFTAKAQRTQSVHLFSLMNFSTLFASLR